MKNWHKNFILTLVSIIVSYAIIETFVWRNFLHHVPLTLHQSLGRLQHLAQTSKKSVTPENYVLLIGDSHAEGLGDRLLQVVRETSPKFNAAHVVHDLTSRDVITFGYRGGYPSQTYVFSTYKSYHGLKLYRGLDIQPPKDIVVFYNEGNDLNDEMTNVRFWLPASFDKTKIRNQAYVNAFMDERATVGIAASERRWHIFRNAHLLDTATKWVKMSVQNLFGQSDVLLTADDPAFRIGKEYRPNWSRIRNGQTEISVAGETQNYPSPTVESFAFHDDEEVETGTVFFKASLKKVKDLFPSAQIRVLYIPTPLISYHLVSPSVQLQDRVRFAESEQAGPVTDFSREYVYERSNRLCKSVEKASIELGTMFADSRVFLRDTSFREGYLHGPNDPGHFNWKGYQALGKFIADTLGTSENVPCSTIELN